MYTHTSFGFCVTDHKQWFLNGQKILLNKCTCAHFLIFKIAAQVHALLSICSKECNPQNKKKHGNDSIFTT